MVDDGKNKVNFRSESVTFTIILHKFSTVNNLQFYLTKSSEKKQPPMLSLILITSFINMDLEQFNSKKVNLKVSQFQLQNYTDQN